MVQKWLYRPCKQGCIHQWGFPNTRLKVILHELGHLEHNSKDYERLREKYEAQANRSMIHELLKNENLDDFNYLHFMEKYNLTTICDETFVKNEYLKMMR
nr:MAG TPA: IrrE protein [Caudoviricetes sp.]